MERQFSGAYLDVDKTLMTGDDRPSEKVLSALKKINRVGANTTRNISQLEKVIKPEEVSLPSIVLGGAEVWEPGKELIKAFPLSKEAVDAVSGLIKNQLDKIKLTRFYPTGTRQLIIYTSSEELETKFRNIYTQTNSLKEMHRESAGYLESMGQSLCSAILIRLKEGQELVIPEKIYDLAEIDDSVSGEITITQKGVSKASTLLWVCGEIGIKPEDLLTAGDSQKTDSPVFEYTYGVSVGKEVLQNAKESVSSIDELAELLEKKFS